MPTISENVMVVLSGAKIVCRPEMQCLHASSLETVVYAVIGFITVIVCSYLAAKTW